MTPTHHTLHRMCFARRRLTIRENSAVVSSQHIRHNRLSCFIVDLLLGCIWLKYFVEKIDFALCEKKKNEILLDKTQYSMYTKPIYRRIFQYTLMYNKNNKTTDTGVGLGVGTYNQIYVSLNVFREEVLCYVHSTQTARL